MATPRTCAACGIEFTPGAKASKARFCSGACRVAAAKSRRLGTPESRPDLRAIRGEVADEPEADDPELLSLEDLAKLLAGKLRAGTTPPTAIANLAAQYRTTLDEVERRRVRVADPVERLLRSVAEKSS